MLNNPFLNDAFAFIKRSHSGYAAWANEQGEDEAPDMVLRKQWYNLFEKHGIPVTEQAADSIEKYCDLMEWKRKNWNYGGRDQPGMASMIL